ncbi:MAG: hypothetical protein NC253_01650 [Ruminococcus sp.]|nr:hypothetical protein [Ruminococcus sp.]MCM1380739.1 hypothetical protein [Muribaculaceae bacterium]MCM1478863.1 hypothetical protein [Muribaculaceae bacterium]
MKRTKIILAAILALTLTACSDTSTAEVTEEITESSVSETTSEVTTTEVTTTAEETTTTAEVETAAETKPPAPETEGTDTVKDTSAEADVEILPRIYADILCNETEDSSTMSFKANLIDFDSDGISELIITRYYMSGHDYTVYKSDGSVAEGLWNDYSLLEDYTTTEKEYYFKHYKNTETGSDAVMYVCRGRGNGMPNLFTYAMDAVMLPESLIAEAVTANDYTTREMELTVYINGEAVGSAAANSTRNESGDTLWNDWESLTDVNNLYDTYFGKYELVSEDIASLNPITVNGSDEIYINGEPFIGSEELAEIIENMLIQDNS